MADLTQLDINKDVKEQADFTVLPPAKYQAIIVADQLKDTKENNGKYLELKLQIIEHKKYDGTVIIDRLNLQNRNQQAADIGAGTLKTICNITQVEFPPKDTSDMYGKPLTISLGVNEFKSNTTGKKLKSNYVKGYSPKSKLNNGPSDDGEFDNNNW